MTRYREEDEPVSIPDVRAVAATSKALLVEIDGDETWVPQSQIHDNSEVWQVDDEGELVVTGWFARQRGWS